jgi:hypothetical protein
MKQAREIVDQAPTQFDHLAIRKGLKERVDRLGPQAEGGARRERIALRHQAGRLAVARQQLASEAALSDARLAD